MTAETVMASAGDFYRKTFPLEGLRGAGISFSLSPSGRPQIPDVVTVVSYLYEEEDFDDVEIMVRIPKPEFAQMVRELQGPNGQAEYRDDKGDHLSLGVDDRGRLRLISIQSRLNSHDGMGFFGGNVMVGAILGRESTPT